MDQSDMKQVPEAYRRKFLEVERMVLTRVVPGKVSARHMGNAFGVNTDVFPGVKLVGYCRWH